MAVVEVWLRMLSVVIKGVVIVKDIVWLLYVDGKGCCMIMIKVIVLF